MATHTLPSGRVLIDGLVELGAALGYVPERELPVERRRLKPPAVDVAWLSEEGQEYPLMIFEVEIRVTNSAANNAVKVFGQPNERFERPLFFFHIFLTGGTDTSRIDTLRASFGLHNYRTYRLDQNETNRLVEDVLSQHRRLHKKLSIPRLLTALRSCIWKDIDLGEILLHIESLNFDGNFLSEYAKAGLESHLLQEHFIRLLSVMHSNPPQRITSYNYGTFLGQSWSVPIHIGLMALTRPKQQDWLERLRYWQERSSYMTMIGPHFGLARDYDDFVLGLAPVLWAFVAALTHSIDGASEYIGDQYREVLIKLEGATPIFSFFTAIWMLHVAAAFDDEVRYNYAQSFLNDRGGIAPDVLYEPPSMISVVEMDENWRAALATNHEPVPELASFRQELPRHYNRTTDPERALVQLGLSVLTNAEAIYEWSGHVALLLHAFSGLTFAAKIEDLHAS